MNMKTSPNDVSNQEIFNKLDQLSLKIDGVGSSLNEKIDGVHAETLEAIHELSSQTDVRFCAMEREQARVRAVMVTKDYLDDKLARQYSDIVQHTRREIEKAMR